MRTRVAKRPAPPPPAAPSAYNFPDRATIDRLLDCVHVCNIFLVKGSEGDWRLLALNLPIYDPAAMGMIPYVPPATPTSGRRQPSSEGQLTLVRGGRS